MRRTLRATRCIHAASSNRSASLYPRGLMGAVISSGRAAISIRKVMRFKSRQLGLQQSQPCIPYLCLDPDKHPWEILVEGLAASNGKHHESFQLGADSYCARLSKYEVIQVAEWKVPRWTKDLPGYRPSANILQATGISWEGWGQSHADPTSGSILSWRCDFALRDADNSRITRHEFADANLSCKPRKSKLHWQYGARLAAPDSRNMSQQFSCLAKSDSLLSLSFGFLPLLAVVVIQQSPRFQLQSDFRSVNGRPHSHFWRPRTEIFKRKVIEMLLGNAGPALLAGLATCVFLVRSHVALMHFPRRHLERLTHLIRSCSTELCISPYTTHLRNIQGLCWPSSQIFTARIMPGKETSILTCIVAIWSTVCTPFAAHALIRRCHQWHEADARHFARLPYSICTGPNSRQYA